MRRPKLILALTLASTLLVAPAAFAFYDVVHDSLDSETGTGVAIVHVVDNIYATVWYVDSDGDGQYSEGDLRLRMVPFRL